MHGPAPKTWGTQICEINYEITRTQYSSRSLSGVGGLMFEEWEETGSCAPVAG